MNRELDFVRGLIARYPRSNRQLNRPFYSDAEILKTDGGHLYVSIDTVSEEFEMGLLRDAKTFGWMTVTASASDLAAVGVKPLIMCFSRRGAPSPTSSASASKKGRGKPRSFTAARDSR